MEIEDFNYSAGGSVVRWFGGSVAWRVGDVWLHKSEMFGNMEVRNE